ncbi:MAG: dihydroorotate dehydrogenase [Clostridia bacterium]|jgi:dihydroorotate dehydrogenase (NAD+) catalytic subunit|nr:dihydroorotate dehydrogenase [Clostridia bacterium]
MSKVDLSVEIAGIKMKNPVMTASGTFSFGEAYTDFFSPACLGALVVTCVTLEPRAGNPSPRLVETPAGLLNSIGLENPGADVVLEKLLPPLEQYDVPIIVNIAGNTLEEYGQVAAKLSTSTVVKGLEVNISCPNVREGGLAFGSQPEMAAQVIKMVKANTDLPVIAKLSPNVTDIGTIAKAVEEAGADALSLINTLLGMAIDIHKKRPVLANVVGGLSGPAIKPVGVRMVWQVAEQVQIPLIGMGGIMNTADALEYIMAGATAVAVGTGQFVNPRCCIEIIEGLEEFCREQGIEKITELKGVARA